MNLSDSTMVLESMPQPGAVMLTLHRPQQHNALNSQLISELHTALLRLKEDACCRVVVLTGSGKSFCAGADLSSMRAQGQSSVGANDAGAVQLAQLLLTLHQLPQPTIAVIRGAAIGGGLGLAAASDICVCANSTRFCFPELRLGLLPAVVSPYVCAAIGMRAMLALTLSSEDFDAAEAQRLGLVHRCYADDDLDSASAALISSLLRQGPAALLQLKSMLRHVVEHPIGEPLALWTARQLAQLRAGAEAQEGMLAALERREPSWLP
jgi:methylglutaconyl-CoA hydratase